MLKWFSKFIGILLATLALMIVGTQAASAQTSSVASTAPDSGVIAHAKLPTGSSAPCVVRGFTWHAIERMYQARVSPDSVEDVVYSGCSRAWWRADTATWQYWSSGWLFVAVNSNGYVVTVGRIV